MPLHISAVERLEDVIGPARAFLEHDDDLFARPRIVVPTPGARAWLHDRLARELGSSGRNDGIVANVDISYPGTIVSLLQPPRTAEAVDAWSLDRLTFAVLDLITGTAATGLGIPFAMVREPLLSARRIAGLFDNYHVRRPGMILEWERERPNRVLSPTANDEQQDGVPVPGKLRDSDHWQFELWRAVRQKIGSPSPPARLSLDHWPPGERLLVAGLQSLSLQQVRCLQLLGSVGDVRVLLVHPSAGLRARWGQSLPRPSPTMPPQRSKDPEFLDGVDELLPIWLAGSKELQHLLASQAVSIDEQPAAAAMVSDTLLGRMQQTILTGGTAEPREHDPTDRSVAIHRCHSLSRQAEVLHDALLQAFAEIEGLQPHDVVIVSPCIDKAAAHLEAVFQRSVFGRDAAGEVSPITLPLVVADRGIRAVNEAADLLVDLLALPGSRCSVDDVLDVAGHPLVRAHVGADDDTAAAWADLTERTQVRWGLDAGHRARRGLELPAFPDLHTWQLGLERMLLGATLPDAAPRPELGGVVPLPELDPADIPAIAMLVRIIDVIRTLEATTATSRPVAAWCDLIETALVGLCGPETAPLSEPLAQLRRLRAAAAGTPAEATAVPFDDVRQLLATWLDEQPGRQPLRTGAITATSMVPLRGVPFKVICVIGFDDGAVGVSDTEGDDLVGQQQLVGDVDPRSDERRALLDCLLAAQHRLVIACNGRSIRNNQPLPLVTPLQELVDFAVRHGVRRAKLSDPSGIEVDHPRHHLSPRNFAIDGVETGVIWSHDTHAAKVAAIVAPGARAAPITAPGVEAAVRPAESPAPPAVSPQPVIDLALLERMVADPLTLYLKETLGISTWRDDEEATPATFPLTLATRAVRSLTLELLHLIVADPGAEAAWIDGVRRSGRLPVGPHGDRQLEEIVQLASGIRDQAREQEVPLIGAETREIRIDLAATRVTGFLTGVHEASRRLVVVTTGKANATAYGRPLLAAAVKLVAARAAGLGIDTVAVVSRHNDWKPGALTTAGRPVKPCQIRTVSLDAGMDPTDRLANFCRLAQDALAGPCGLFGLENTKPADRVTAFDSFVSAKDWSLDKSLYATKNEAVVYGLSPGFGQIFAPASRELAFLDRFIALLKLTSSGMKYTLT